MRDRFVLAMLLIASCAITAGRISSVPGPFGPNDLSRWATIAALLETQSYQIGKRITQPDGSHRDLKAPVMVDVLLDPETNTFYSSKPPLLPTLLAGEMFAMERVLGWEPASDSLEMLRVLLLTSNLLPIALCLFALLLTLARLEASARASVLLMSAACFGTLMTTFATSLTNHVGATAGAGLALYAVVRIWLDPTASSRWFVLAGVSAGWLASQEVPALIAVFVLAWPLFIRDRKRTLAIYLPAALVPLLAFFVTNQIALGDPFWFYHPDSTWSKFPGSYWTQRIGIDVPDRSASYVFHFILGHHGVLSLAPIFIASFAGMVRPQHKWRWLTTAFVLALIVMLRQLYQTLGVPLPVMMAPLVLLSIAALYHPRGWWNDPSRTREMIPRVAAALTLTTFGFYLVHTTNYGGVSCGPRWLMWLAPFWLIAALDVVEDALRSKTKTWLLALALAVSIFSASHPGLNPWTHPWLYSLTRD